jgi:serine/threonine protein kinase/tetratricopeptide (TPR) repeat protein
MSNADPPDDPGTRSTPGLNAPRSSAGPTFSPGRTLAGRFRVLRFIARGGMGEVYEAEDLELGEHVALKTVRPEIAGDPHALERFKTEVHLARKVTHPSACRIFDVFHHRAGSDEPGAADVTFLTMELLRGETLAERLARAGRMPHREALPLVEQMAGALEAAHRAGVIHRDFKSANVMLVPQGPDPSCIRAVVTDFGLARRDPGADGSIVTDTFTAAVAGTPAYMAPEQIEGGPITAATDIYALGIVMYEMLTGRQPFEGETPLAGMVKRLKVAPVPPRVFVTDLNPLWESTVLRCLEREPENRFASAVAVVKALHSEGAPAAASPVPARRRRVSSAIVAAALVATVALGLLGWWAVRRLASPSGPSRVSGTVAAVRRSVAVLGLRNLTGRAEAAWLAVALAEMLTSELGAGEVIRTIPGEMVARLRAELPLADFDSLARDTLARVRERLGSDLLVLGSFTALGDKAGGQLRLDVRLQDTAIGETVASVSQTGTESELFDLVSRTGAELRRKLGVGAPTAAESDAVRASLPRSPDAARLYAEGLERLRLFDALGARALLEKAQAADPTHALTRSALSSVWSMLGYDARAGEEAKRAVDLAASLARQDRMSIEGRYFETAREWDKAIEIYKSLFELFPDNLDYGLRLASAQESAGKGKDGLATLDALRRLPAPAGLDPRIDLMEAVVARYLSESRRGWEAASRAAGTALAQGARHLLARARFEEGSNLQNIGRMDEAVAALEEAERLFEEAGDLRGMAGSMNNRALVVAGRGDLDGAEKLSNEALAAYRSIGNKSGEALMLGNLGNIEYFRGNLAAARRRWEETLPTYREINEKDGEGQMLNNIASVLGEQGDIRGARTMFEQAVAVFRGIGRKSGVGSALGNIARCYHQEGDLAAAGSAYEESLAIWRETGDKQYAAPAIQDHGGLLRDRGDAAGARRAYDEALALRQEMGQEGEAADARLAILDLDVSEGRAKEAEAPARDALEVFLRLKSTDGEASARVLLARIAAALGRSAEAADEAGRARTLAAKSQNRNHRLLVEIECARVLGTLGDREQAASMESLRLAEAEAARSGVQSLIFEARLALGEVEARSSQAEAKARLLQVQREAEAKGYGRVAALAASAAAR